MYDYHWLKLRDRCLGILHLEMICYWYVCVHTWGREGERENHGPKQSHNGPGPQGSGPCETGMQHLFCYKSLYWKPCYSGHHLDTRNSPLYGSVLWFSNTVMYNSCRMRASVLFNRETSFIQRAVSAYCLVLRIIFLLGRCSVYMCSLWQLLNLSHVSVCVRVYRVSCH